MRQPLEIARRQELVRQCPADDAADTGALEDEKATCSLHDGEKGVARGGLARPARKACRSGPQAVGMAVDGTGVARGFAQVRLLAYETCLFFEFVCAVTATWQ